MVEEIIQGPNNREFVAKAKELLIKCKNNELDKIKKGYKFVKTNNNLWKLLSKSQQEIHFGESMH